MIRRLQLGTSCLEDLDVRVLDKFLDKSWVHLGDADSVREPRNLSYYYRMFRGRPLEFIKLVVLRVSGRQPGVQRTTRDPEELRNSTNFQPFYFKKGDRLPFDDGSFDYILSEHFFHHLFFDEAFSLFEECHRVLKPHGVVRTVVPDADLRTYSAPEPAGFPDVRMSFTEPLKHKTRYSVYMLSEILRLAGFKPIALRYCDRHGNHIEKDPAEMGQTYARCPERELVFQLDHVLRLDSLIVDGLKEPAQARG